MLQLSCARCELQKEEKTQKKAFARPELLAEAAMPLGKAHQDPSGLPHIVWADVISRGPQDEAQRREAAKERRKYVRARLGPSNVHRESEGCRVSKNLEGTQLLRLQQMIREERQERGRGHQLAPLLPALENSASPGKRIIKTIQVDLHPLLEKVVEPSGSWPEDLTKGVPWGDGWPSSHHERSRGQDLRDGRVRDFLGGRRGDVGGGAEDHVDGTYGGIEGGEDQVDRKHGGPMDGEDHGEDLTHEGSHRTVMRTPIPFKVEGPLRDISWQAKGNFSETLGLGPKNSKASNRQQLPKNSLRAVTILQPQLSSPVFLPSLFPMLPLPTEAESSTGRPAAPSPDFQIPTRLLLRGLQETTTSQNHRVITGILSALREELMAADGPKAGDTGEKRNSFLDLPWIGPRRNGTTDAGQGALDAADGNRMQEMMRFAREGLDRRPRSIAPQFLLQP
ncbi:hypothetical protein JRQ81_008765 [Phrynocephalus forsythii]|uniref:Uncharacterized protein n=1 Tax=Phrynocephalus forsythii TaxID=171643 RepID=A0A9Q1ASS2_9SAUR|nr:hypothetical protein JRQ81_008765 [Phrynocephalus forsythii]